MASNLVTGRCGSRVTVPAAGRRKAAGRLAAAGGRVGLAPPFSRRGLRRRAGSLALLGADAARPARRRKRAQLAQPDRVGRSGQRQSPDPGTAGGTAALIMASSAHGGAQAAAAAPAPAVAKSDRHAGQPSALPRLPPTQRTPAGGGRLPGRRACQSFRCTGPDQRAACCLPLLTIRHNL
jgi:hypothetical protein